MLTTAPPFSMHIVGYLIKRRESALPWVADYRDFWSPSITGWRRKLAILLERRFLCLANAAVFVNKSQRQYALDAIGWLDYPQAYVITNGFDADDFAKLRGRVRPDDGYFTLTYTGSLLHDRMQSQFFPALELACTDPYIRQRLRVRILGNFADLYPDITKRLTNWGVLQVTPFAPYQTALEAIWDADALLIIEPDIYIYRLSHSNKLFEYLAAGRFILAVVPEGEIAQVIREQQAGIVVHPDDQPAIITALRDLITRWEHGNLPVDDGIERNRRFERREIARQFAELFDRLIAMRQGVER